MAELWLRNLISYSLQTAILVMAGGFLLHLLRIRLPKVRLVCLQALLVLCAILPLVQPFRSKTTGIAKIQITTHSATLVQPGQRSSSPHIPMAAFILTILAAGVAVRLGVLSLGSWRLRRYRRTSIYLPNAFAHLQKRLKVVADVKMSGDIAGPVTFGWLHPVILLPETCVDNESIACHELLHVRRRDWLAAVLEEVVLSVYWFHPAIWWLVAEVQLAREETVDRDVVAALNSRSQYLESLLSLAAARAGLDLAPASQFLRTRHLQKRVSSLLEEVSMSKFRLTSSLATFAAALALAGWFGVRSFPLQAAPQEKIDAPGVAVQPGALTLLHRAPVQYPPDAIAKRIEGTVVLELTLGETGTVQDARVINGPDELRNAALKSVLQWHYASDSKVAAKTQVAIEFKLPPAGAPPAAVAIRPAVPPASTVKRIVIQTPDYVKQRIENRVTLREGDQLTQAAVDDLFTGVKEVDEHLMVSLQPTSDPLASIVTIYLPPAIAPPPVPQSIRVGANVVAANLIHKAPRCILRSPSRPAFKALFVSRSP